MKRRADLYDFRALENESTNGITRRTMSLLGDILTIVKGGRYLEKALKISLNIEMCKCHPEADNLPSTYFINVYKGESLREAITREKSG